MLYNYFLGLGSNIEPRLGYLNTALNKLTRCGEIIQKSALYESQPWGKKEQDEFYNAVVEFRSALSPRSLLAAIQTIEKESGRSTPARWGPRQIDIDILYCREISLEEEDLQIPHRYLMQRRFVLEPLAELVENLTMDQKNTNVHEMLQLCGDASRVTRLDLAW
jgi:2-amino-4-hydroxy-6-hydroxymethyldihydropteridine diphosphokinase